LTILGRLLPLALPVTAFNLMPGFSFLVLRSRASHFQLPGYEYRLIQNGWKENGVEKSLTRIYGRRKIRLSPAAAINDLSPPRGQRCAVAEITNHYPSVNWRGTPSMGEGRGRLRLATGVVAPVARSSRRCGNCREAGQISPSGTGQNCLIGSGRFA
jgi:hypothetical protein